MIMRHNVHCLVTVVVAAVEIEEKREQDGGEELGEQEKEDTALFGHVHVYAFKRKMLCLCFLVCFASWHTAT